MPYLVTGGTGGSAASLVTFGLLDDGDGVALSVNLYDAVITHAESNRDEFTSGLPGGMFVGKGDLNTPAPYVSLALLTATGHRNTGRGRWVEEEIRATIFAPSFHEAWTLGEELGEMFDEDLRLYHRDARGVRVWPGEFHYVGEDTFQGRVLHHGYVDLRFVYSKTRQS